MQAERRRTGRVALGSEIARRLLLAAWLLIAVLVNGASADPFYMGGDISLEPYMQQQYPTVASPQPISSIRRQHGIEQPLDTDHVRPRGQSVSSADFCESANELHGLQRRRHSIDRRTTSPGTTDQGRLSECQDRARFPLLGYVGRSGPPDASGRLGESVSDVGTVGIDRSELHADDTAGIQRRGSNAGHCSIGQRDYGRHHVADWEVEFQRLDCTAKRQLGSLRRAVERWHCRSSRRARSRPTYSHLAEHRQGR